MLGDKAVHNKEKNAYKTLLIRMVYKYQRLLCWETMTSKHAMELIDSRLLGHILFRLCTWVRKHLFYMDYPHWSAPKQHLEHLLKDSPMTPCRLLEC